MGPGLKSRSCLTASGTGRLVEPSHMLQQSLRAIGGSHRHRLVTRNLPHRPVLGLERPLGIGGGPERPRLLQPPLTTPRQLVVVLELGGVVLIQKWPLPGHRRVPLPEERAGQRSLPHSCLLSPRLHRARPGGGACGSHLRGPALRRPQRASGPAALCGQGMVFQARLCGDAGLRAGAVAPLSLEPGGHGARGPTLVGAGAADDGRGLAGRGGTHGQALHQRAGGALRPQPGPRLFHENFQSPGGWGGLQLAPDLHGCRGPHALGPRLRHRAAFSNSSYRPVHDFIMGAEYTAVARVRRALAEVPKRYLKCLKTDCLVMQDVPKKHRSAIERLLRLSHRDGTPVYRCEPTEGLRGQYREPRMEAEPIREKPAWRRVEDPLTHCLGGESLLLTGYPGTGKTHLARKIVEALRELGDTVHIITKTHAAVQNVGLGAQTADHWVRRNVRSGRCSATWLVIEELTQLDTPLWADIACLSMNTSMRFLLLGDFRQLPAVLDSFAGAEVCRELKDSQLLHDLAGGWCHELSERWRFDEGVFSFLQWLRVDEAEQVPLREAVQMARQRFPRRGEPEVCLVISHAKRLQINERENRRRAPEDALLVQYAGPETAGTNAPQTMRVWPGLRLVGAGGKVQKGVFVTVSEVGERVALESGQSFEPRELLKHTRLCSAITYASVQGLTLRGRVWLCDVDSPHFTMKHLYMGCSRATSSELLSVL